MKGLCNIFQVALVWIKSDYWRTNGDLLNLEDILHKRSMVISLVCTDFKGALYLLMSAFLFLSVRIPQFWLKTCDFSEISLAPHSIMLVGLYLFCQFIWVKEYCQELFSPTILFVKSEIHWKSFSFTFPSI